MVTINPSNCINEIYLRRIICLRIIAQTFPFCVPIIILVRYTLSNGLKQTGDERMRPDPSTYQDGTERMNTRFISQIHCTANFILLP